MSSASIQILTGEQHTLLFAEAELSTLTPERIYRHTRESHYGDRFPWQHIVPVLLELNTGIFSSLQSGFPTIRISQENRGLIINCSCSSRERRLCEHQAQVLVALVRRDDFRIFFDAPFRLAAFKKAAPAYGLENEADQDGFFKPVYSGGKLQIVLRQAAILPVTPDSLDGLHKQLFKIPVPLPVLSDSASSRVVIVLKQHKYYRHLQLELLEVNLTKEGKLKNPFTPLNPQDAIWDEDDPMVLKFYSGIHKFQSPVGTDVSDKELTALRAVLKNPKGYLFYAHDNSISENITAASLTRVSIQTTPAKISLVVDQKDQFFELTASIELKNGLKLSMAEISLRFGFFMVHGGVWYLLPDRELAGIIDLFKKKSENLLVHSSKFPEFRSRILSPLEDAVAVKYTGIKPASKKQLEQFGFNGVPEKVIYLKDFGQHIMLIPVLRYGEVEIPIRTRRQIYGLTDTKEDFSVKRDEETELGFISMITRQHSYFAEQLDNSLEYFYLHRKHFLDEDWFLTVFESWSASKIEVLGFNELDGNKLNGSAVSITISVLTGINWFNAEVKIRFGKKKASLKQVQKALKNKSRYIQLDDGTLGIVPEVWLEKFSAYFKSADIADDENLRIPKVNFAAIDLLFDQDMLDEAVIKEIDTYNQIGDPGMVAPAVPVPDGFMGVLRPYQQEGLNWLSQLDRYGFGGCLADDMGLGKTIQIIAFILSQRRQGKQNTNLIIVPTSVLSNWQEELRRFAPSVSMLNLYGPDRSRSVEDFDKYEVVLTTYGTLVLDAGFLKTYLFNYVFADESQTIKNASSLRNRAVKMLKSRNKIVITGTPVENNTGDLYGQLSVACPGLLGTRQFFREQYAIPIDRFKNLKQSVALRQKIKPFILRRTKAEVAPELPEKTEMVLYCEMKEEQRSIYDAALTELRDYVSASTGEELRRTPMSVLKGLTRLRQICDSPRLLKDPALPGLASAKIDMLMEEVEGKIGQHKILIFSQFTTMLDLIGDELRLRKHGFSYLSGASRNRGAIVEEFQTNEAIRIFLISLKAGGTGLNLTRADYVYLVDPWWNPAVENQAIDRSHRIGQLNNIVAVRLICPDTIEEKVMKLQESKQALADQLIIPEPVLPVSLSRNELLELLG